MHPDLAPRNASCLLFDWDGTLVDSQYANYRAMAAVLSPKVWNSHRNGSTHAPESRPRR